MLVIKLVWLNYVVVAIGVECYLMVVFVFYVMKKLYSIIRKKSKTHIKLYNLNGDKMRILEGA